MFKILADIRAFIVTLWNALGAFLKAASHIAKTILAQWWTWVWTILLGAWWFFKFLVGTFNRFIEKFTQTSTLVKQGGKTISDNVKLADINSGPTEWVELVNYIFALEETILVLALLVSLSVVCYVYRFIKSLIPTMT